MKRYTSITSFGIATVAALLWATPAHAQAERPWSVSFDAGAQVAV